MIWIDLLYNLSLLIALSVVSGFVDLRQKRDTLAGKLLQGVVFGGAAAIGMLRPFVFGTGLIFDGRSVLISLGSLFFGPWTAAVACLITVTLRLVQGGAGATMGVLVILVSAMIGLCFRLRKHARIDDVSTSTLLLFGLTVHLAMLAMSPSLPTDMILPVLKRIALPVLLVYPLATVLIGKILSDQATRSRFLDELRQSEKRHRAILRTAMDGCWLADREGRLLQVNESYCRMSGYSEKELLSMRIIDLDANETAEDTSAHIKRIIEEGETRFETKHRRKDGSLFDVLISAQSQPEAGDGFVVFLQDITERKRTDLYREMGLTILHILNEKGDLNDSIDRVLTELKAKTGFDAVGIRLQDGDDFPYFAQQGFPPDFMLVENSLVCRSPSGDLCRDKDGQVCLEGTCGLVISGKADTTRPPFTQGGSFWTNQSTSLIEPTPEQDPRLHPRNRCCHLGFASMALIPIRDKDRIVGLIHLNARRKGCLTLAAVELLEGIASHIGESLMRKRSEEALRISESKHRAIISASPVPMALNDDQQRITFLNPAFVQTFGYTLEDIPTISHWWPVAYPDPDYRRRVMDTWHSALRLSERSGAVFSPMEVTVRCKNGTDKIVLVSASSFVGSFKETHLIVLYDITAHKRAEEELLKMQKLQSVGTLAGGIAHDFNNILLGIFGNVSMAKDELPKDHPGYTLLEESEKSMTRAVRLTKQLLTFAKGGEPIKESVNLGALVEETARFDLSGSTVSLVFRQADDLWAVHADKGQIQQVVSNLAINACQAMPNGGHLYVTLENKDIHAEDIQGLRPGRYVTVAVRDEGTGIEQNLLSQIFDPYFTTKKTGSGLGLATVYSILHKHNGHIGVVSELGKGSTFTFCLPASDSPQKAEFPQPAPERPFQPRCARILVMDDEASVCKLVVRMLKPCGFSLVTASDGEEAVAIYKQALEAGAPFDAVIMDMTIPGGVGGLQAIKDLLAINPDVRAIVSSGYAEDPVLATPSAYGFKGSAAKPYTVNELREAVWRVLE